MSIKLVMYWRKEEDAELENHVNIYGEGDWKRVASLLGRSENSCFQRWSNQLKPGLEHKDITHEESIAILQLHKKYGGNKWSKIAKELSKMSPDKGERTGNKIKNFWNGPLKKMAFQLGLEPGTEDFLIAMTNMRGEIPPTTTIDFGDNEYGFSWDHLANGASFTLDDIPPMN